MAKQHSNKQPVKAPEVTPAAVTTDESLETETSTEVDTEIDEDVETEEELDEDAGTEVDTEIDEDSETETTDEVVPTLKEDEGIPSEGTATLTPDPAPEVEKTPEATLTVTHTPDPAAFKQLPPVNKRKKAEQEIEEFKHSAIEMRVRTNNLVVFSGYKKVIDIITRAFTAPASVGSVFIDASNIKRMNSVIDTLSKDDLGREPTSDEIATLKAKFKAKEA